MAALAEAQLSGSFPKAFPPLGECGSVTLTTLLRPPPGLHKPGLPALPGLNKSPPLPAPSPRLNVPLKLNRSCPPKLLRLLLLLLLSARALRARLLGESCIRLSTVCSSSHT
jgi:hypothetical protein